MKNSFSEYVKNLKITEEDKKRGLELIDLMNKAGLKGDYKIQGEFIDGNYFDVIWEKSETAKFGILFYAHGGDDVIQWKVRYNGKDEYNYREELCTDTNEKLLKVLEDFNRDNYIITWTGLFGMKHEECIYDRNVDKYKNNKKYNIFKF